MKFISCHIENFGKLSDFSFEFSEGTNVICEKNGWGKSTFAAFIRAMFYGLEGGRKRNHLENERKKYKPWQGGVFGGWLIFQIQGKQYQISRIFHDKDLNDEFELRDVKTNLVSRDYSKNIGEEIFQIDRESFLRTVFIGQSECETSSTDDINAKIGNPAGDANDLNHFDAAYARLTETVNALTPSRASGALAKRREEIAYCERIFKEGENLPENMEIYQGRVRAQEEAYNALKAELLERGKVQEEFSKHQSAFAMKSEWMRLENMAEEKREEQEAIKRRFPGKIPSLSQVKAQIDLCGELGKAYERMSLYRMGKEEKQKLFFLEKIFGDGTPGAEELEGKKKEALELLRLKREYDAKQMSEQERERLFALAPGFLDETKDASFLAANWAQRNHKKAAMPSNEAAMEAFAAQKKQGVPSKGYMAFLVMGILLVAAGIVAGVYSLVAGMVAAVIGVGMVLAGILKKKGGTSGFREENPEIEKLRCIIRQDTAFIAQTDAEVAAYLKAHGRGFEAGNEHAVALALQEIAMEHAEYQALRKKAQSAKADAGAGQIYQYQESIGAFLSRYGADAPQENYMEELYALRERAVSYAALADKWERFQKAEEDYEQIRGGIAAFYKEYGFAPEQNISMQLNEIRDAVDDYEDAVRACERADDELMQFEQENDIFSGLKADGEENLPSLEQIHERILALNEEMERVQTERAEDVKTLEDLRIRYDEWEENRVKLEQLRQAQEMQQKKYELVAKAREKLGQAKEAMTAKYAAPILAAFGKYYEMIAGTSAKNFHVDANTQVTVEEYGKQREAEMLSRGWRDLAGICLRVAFVDAMYPQEAPVLVMDDPFTNLDDEKIAAGKRFLAETAKKYQIVYFTCSAARE